MYPKIALLFLSNLSVTFGVCPFSRTSQEVPNDNNSQQVRCRRSELLAEDKTTKEKLAAIIKKRKDQRLLQQANCVTHIVYDNIHDDIASIAGSIGDIGEKGHFFGGIVRLAAHDFMDYDRNSANPGGSDGCLDFSDPENAGLSDIWCDDPDGLACPLKSLYDSAYSSFMSKADFWVASANAVIKITSVDELELPFRWGRIDSDTCAESSERLPAASGCTEVEETFIDRMGLSWTDAVALMGAHTLGRGDAEFSGHDGTWVDTDEQSIVFDKRYYEEVLRRSWRPQTTDAGTDWTWGGSDLTVMMLNTDICLYYDIPDGDDQTCCTDTTGNCRNIDEQCPLADTTRPESFEAFDRFLGDNANDNEPFYEAYSAAWELATENGHSELFDIDYLDDTCVPRTSDGPNIIVMQADDLPHYVDWNPPPGGVTEAGLSFPTEDGTMPNFDILRMQGLEMKQAYTASAKCGTSRYSTITGRYPSRSANSRVFNTNAGNLVSEVTIPTTKLNDVGTEKDCSEDNLARIFQRNSYRTGFFGKWHLHRTEDPSPDNYANSKSEIEECGFDYADGIYVENLMTFVEETNHNLEWMTGLAVDFINDDVTYGDKPFFMYFNPTVPHSSGDVEDAIRNGSCRDTPNGDQEEPFIKGMVDADDENCSNYRQSVMDRATLRSSGSLLSKDLGLIWIDDAIGALLTALEDKGELSNTLFLFQLDHGVGGKGSLYEGGNRIAQFIHYPDAFGQSGMTFDGLVSTIDIGPTLLDYAGIDSSSPGYYEMDGISWKSAIFDSEEEETWRTERCLLFEFDNERAVRCGCEKYAEIGFSPFYFDLCDSANEYINYPGDDPEDENLEDSFPDRVIVMEDVLYCFEGKTMPHLDRDFTVNECKDLYSARPTSPPSPPTPSPVCEDTHGAFEIDNGTMKDCVWVGNRPVRRCGNYADFCPQTCGEC